MTPQDLLKEWRVFVSVVALFGGGVVGTGVYADGKPTREEVEKMIATAPPIIVLQQDVKHLIDEVDKNQIRTNTKLEKILTAVNNKPS